MMNDTERRARAAKVGYTHLLVFTRERKNGDLHDDTLPFCSEKDAVAWVHAINRRAAKVGYRVVTHKVEAL